MFGSNFEASDVSRDALFRLWELTHFYPASACACLIACFSRCVRRVVYVCGGQECFQGKLDERHRSAEIRRVKVSFRGAEKLPACLRNARRLLAGFLSQVAPRSHTPSFQTARHANGPKSHAIEFASKQHTNRTLWHVLPVYHWALIYLLICKEPDTLPTHAVIAL